MMRIAICLLFVAVALGGCVTDTPTHVKVDWGGCWTGEVNGEAVSGCGVETFALNGQKQTISFTRTDSSIVDFCAAWIAGDKEFGRQCTSTSTVYMDYDYEPIGNETA